MKLLLTCLVICWTSLVLLAQHTPVPTLRTSSDSLTMYLDGQKDEFNGINKLGSSFQYSFVVPKDSAVFTLVSQSDSLSLVLRPKKNTVFQIVRLTKKDTITCAFTMQKLVKPASFSDQYKAANEGKSIIEIPEVYELVNIIFALTRYGQTNAIEKNTDYYKTVMDHYTPYKQQVAVRVMDSLLNLSPAFYYQHLKMDSYAYVFAGNKISNGGIYDRIGSGDKNELEDYLPLLETFAQKSGFRKFYQRHTPYYVSLKKAYKDNINVVGMKSWLDKQFPTTKYSAIKVIFSPLVGWNQSANFFNDNGFTEAQAHVNYPFMEKKDKKQSAAVLKGKRLLIAFTEINHAYLNPEAEKHKMTIAAALKDLSLWTIKGKPSANYDNALVCFEEYLNYGLVTLYYADLFDQKTFNYLNANLENSMVVSRGFPKFKEFNQELLRLYKSRKPGQTVADLYPGIIDWTAKQGIN